MQVHCLSPNGLTWNIVNIFFFFWIPLLIKIKILYQIDSNTNAGRILVSFNFFENALPIKGLPPVYPEMEKYEMKIKILGLRNLKSLGLLPVKRPFIKFDINSLKAKDQKQALAEKQTVQTQPKETGSDPVLSTILTYINYKQVFL